MTLPVSGPDAPQVIDVDDLDEAPTWLPATQELNRVADIHSDVRDLSRSRAAAP